MVPYYRDDHVTIYHGDCLELSEWLAAAVMVTDPPYGIAWRRGRNRARSSRPHAGIAGDASAATRDAALERWAPRPAVVFGSFAAPFPAYRHLLVWQKPADAGVVGSTTGWRRDVEPMFIVGDWPQRVAGPSSVIRSTIPNIGNPSSPAGQTGHPHAKPVDLMRYLLAACPPGVVADPFMGSGSTLRAAKDMGRHAIGVELEERYCEVAARRCAQEVLDVGA